MRLKGYKIISQNWRTRFGEIDLIAKDGDTLVFIEVKARTNLAYGQPEEAITFKKRQKLLTLARLYLANYPQNSKVRFDIIAIDFFKKTPQIKHYKGALEENDY